MTFSAAQLARTARDWSATAGEPVRVEQIGSTIFGFCSELGALRLMRSYRWTLINRGDIARASYSANLKSWFFSLDPAGSIPAPNANLSAPQEA